MKKKSLYKKDKELIRILEEKEDKVLIIDCVKKAMPKWIPVSYLSDFEECKEEEKELAFEYADIETMDAELRKVAYQHFTIISGILPFVDDKRIRSRLIGKAAEEYKLSKQTIRSYLYLYLVYQDIAVLTPRYQKNKERELTEYEKNMRWGLNKFYYNKNRNSLRTAYTLMLKNKYCDEKGELLAEYPSFFQFRYFYRKTKKMQSYYISREGLKNYQRNIRPLVGDGVRNFAFAPGVGMLDATICDIYLVNEAGQLVGRPILTVCIDGYSGLCCGYSLTWEGGTYSLRNLMLNIITDKVEHCKKFGIEIEGKDWPSKEMPGKLVTDKGSEYISDTFAQLIELGIEIVNLPPYRPELKSSVEKFFDLIQNKYKPILNGKGVIQPDFRERGAHDYRKDASLTLYDFERVILHCIIYYNSRMVFENFPYTAEMLEENIQPYANCFWQWGKTLTGANLITLTSEAMKLTLLPRATGKFTRFGLRVNKMRYHHDNYAEKYLQGQETIVAYNPDDVSFVWNIENGNYIKFELIESRYRGMDLTEVMKMKSKQKKMMKEVEQDKIQADIDLVEHIEAISNTVKKYDNVEIKNIRETRKREQMKHHIDYMKGDDWNE